MTSINFDVKLDQSKIRKVDNPILLSSTKKLHNMLNWKPNSTVRDTITKIWKCDEQLKNILFENTCIHCNNTKILQPVVQLMLH